MIESAIERYHTLLSETGWDATQHHEFMDRLKVARVMYGDRVSVEYLRAQFLSASQHELVRSACKRIWEALDVLAVRIPDEPRLVDELGLNSHERELVAIDPGYPGFSTMARFDSFLAGDHLQFVELNAECPAGPAYTEVMAETFRTLPVMQAFEREFEVQGFRTRDRLVATLLDVYSQWGGQGTPQVAIVDWDGLSTRHEFELCQEYFESKGIPTLIEDPRRLRFEGGRLLASNGTPIDLVYRRVLTAEFIGKWDEVQALVEAYRARAVCVINSFRSKYLHKKMIFGLLTDGRNQTWFSPESREAIARHIPWTRRVQASRTDHHAHEIDLIPFLLENQQTLVLKPNDDYGGKGITIGWTVTAEEWQAAVEKAQQDDYVVQEKVVVSSAEFPTLREGIVYDPLNVDLDPFIWQGEVEGFLTRLSGTALCNVTSGGGIVPTFVIQAKE